MQSCPHTAILRQSGLRDTQTRRLVLEALHRLHLPSSPYDIQKWIARRGATVNAVTVYRTAGVFEQLGILHRHAADGKLSLCRHPGRNEAHAYLRCKSCGITKEFLSEEMTKITRTEARRSGFSDATPLLEIVGLCPSCTPS